MILVDVSRQERQQLQNRWLEPVQRYAKPPSALPTDHT